MTDEFEISEPPPAGNRGMKPWVAPMIAFCREHPGEWVKAPRTFAYPPSVPRTQIKRHGLDAVTRQLGPAEFGLWARAPKEEVRP